MHETICGILSSSFDSGWLQIAVVFNCTKLSANVGIPRFQESGTQCFDGHGLLILIEIALPL